MVRNDTDHENSSERRRANIVSKQMRHHDAASSQAINGGISVDSKNGQDGRGVGRDRDKGGEQEESLQSCTGSSNLFLRDEDSERVFPAPTSHVALLNKELKALETRYFRTRLGLEKTTAKNAQLRREMKTVHGQKAKLERETAKLRHLVDRIQSERKEMEHQAISNRDYAKKIEHRFFMGTKGKSLAKCNLELSSQLRQLTATLKERNEALETTQQERNDARDKLSIVQRALETRLEAFVMKGSLHTGLLFEISKLQDHSEALALQLEQERKLVSTLRTELQSSLKYQEELEDTRTVRETWVATLEKERAALDDKMAQLSGDKQLAACEKATLLRFIHEQAETKFQLEARLQDEQAQRRQKMDRAKHQLQGERHENQKLRTSIELAHQEIERQRVELERVVALLREQQDVHVAQKCRETAQQLEVERLTDARTKLEADRLAAKDVCRELQATVEQYEDSGRQLRSEIKTLEETQRELLKKLETKQLEERALREAMEGALQDLAALSKQRNDAARAMSEAVTISASSLEEQQALEHQVEAQRLQIEKLKSAKNLLQNAMLEQLAALRKQLHIERRQRNEAETRLKQFHSPILEVAKTQQVLSMTRAREDQPHDRETADSDAPQPLPSAPLPSSAPLPPCLSTRLAFARSSPIPSSSTSSSGEEDASEAGDNAFCLVKRMSTASVTPISTDDARAHVSLLELAETSDDHLSHQQVERVS